MTIEDDIAFLGRVPILQRLGAGALRILAIGAENYTVQAGQMLFEAGEAADCAYLIEHGSFTLTPQRLHPLLSLPQPPRPHPPAALQAASR